MFRDENYVNIPGWVINKLDLEPTQIMIYAVIYGLTQQGNPCYAGIEYFIQVTRQSRSTVKRAIKDLEDKELIEVIRFTGKTSLYRPIITTITQANEYWKKNRLQYYKNIMDKSYPQEVGSN